LRCGGAVDRVRAEFGGNLCRAIRSRVLPQLHRSRESLYPSSPFPRSCDRGEQLLGGYVIMEELAKSCRQNPACAKDGQRNAGNLTVCGWFGKSQRLRLLYCRTCKKRLSERKGKPLFRAQLPEPKLLSLLEHVAEGCGVCATNCFSKDWGLHQAATYFTLYSYNFWWPIRTLRFHGDDPRWHPRTPAMAAGLADHAALALTPSPFCWKLVMRQTQPSQGNGAVNTHETTTLCRPHPRGVKSARTASLDKND
jgi:hypothetical protein